MEGWDGGAYLGRGEVLCEEVVVGDHAEAGPVSQVPLRFIPLTVTYEEMEDGLGLG